MTSAVAMVYDTLTMPVGEKERLRKLKWQEDNHRAGQVLTVPYEEALELIQDDPLAQLPGEGDEWYARFLHFIHTDANQTVVGWHRKHNAENCSEMHTQQLSRMFIWRKRRIVHQTMLTEEVARASKRQVFDTHVMQLQIADKYVEKLLDLGVAETNGAKAQSLLKAAHQLQANVLRNQADNLRHGTRFEIEMARLKASKAESAEDLD